MSTGSSVSFCSGLRSLPILISSWSGVDELSLWEKRREFERGREKRLLQIEVLELKTGLGFELGFGEKWGRRYDLE